MQTSKLHVTCNLFNTYKFVFHNVNGFLHVTNTCTHVQKSEESNLTNRKNYIIA